MATNPIVVLVHGAFADASGFAGVIRELQAQGIDARAPMNTLRSLAFDADAVARYASTIDGPIILCGHSYGGAVISQAAHEGEIFPGKFRCGAAARSKDAAAIR